MPSLISSPIIVSQPTDWHWTVGLRLGQNDFGILNGEVWGWEGITHVLRKYYIYDEKAYILTHTHQMAKLKKETTILIPNRSRGTNGRPTVIYKIRSTRVL